MAPCAPAVEVDARQNLDANLWIRSPSVSLVTPEVRVPHPEWLQLTKFDRIANPTFVNIISFYENVIVGDEAHQEQFGIVTSFLKRSLAKVLVDFYPLAGRLTTDERTGDLDLHCNDGGAVFREASTYMSLADMGGPQPMPALSGMECLSNVASVLPNNCITYLPNRSNPAVPVFVVQATLFSCGSIALAANWHHTVADGQSGCHFMKSWAEVAIGKAISVLPSFDRHLLQPRTTLEPCSVVRGISDVPEDNKTENETKELKLSQPLPVKQLPPGLKAPAPWHFEPETKPFFVSAKTVKSLKHEVNSSSENREGTGSGLSSAVSLSAALWKLFAKAKLEEGGESLREEKSKFFMFVEGRKKLGLPAAYFGNVVCCATAESSHEELVSKPVRYGADLIQRSVSKMDAAYFRSFIDRVEEPKTATSKGFTYLKSAGNDVAATFWTFFPLYELDFGWGKPVLSVYNLPPRKHIDALAMMPSPRGTGSMVALVNSGHHRMQTLMRDAEFRRLFSEKQSVQLLRSTSSLPSQGDLPCFQTNALAYSVC